MDSGVAISAVTKQTYVKYFNNYMTHKGNTILKGYNGENFSPLGYFNVKFKCNNKEALQKFYIVENGGPNLLGRDWFDRFSSLFIYLFNFAHYRIK